MHLERARDLPPSRAAFQPLGAHGSWTDSLKDSFTSAHSSAARFSPGTPGGGWAVVSGHGRAGGSLSHLFLFAPLLFQLNAPFSCLAMRGADPVLGGVNYVQ